jgi:hypothetical protein
MGNFFPSGRRGHTTSALLVIMLFLSGVCLLGSIIAFAAANSEESAAQKAFQEHEQEQAQLAKARQRAEARQQERREQEATESQRAAASRAKQWQEEVRQRQADAEAEQRRRAEELRVSQERRDQEAAKEQARQRRAAQERQEATERNRQERQEKESKTRRLENDHNVIKNFIALKVPNSGTLQILRWYDPLRASRTIKDEEVQGQLFRVAGRVAAAVGAPSGAVERKELAVNLYFFLVDGVVKTYQVDERDYRGVKICKILDPIPED